MQKMRTFMIPPNFSSRCAAEFPLRNYSDRLSLFSGKSNGERNFAPKCDPAEHARRWVSKSTYAPRLVRQSSFSVRERTPERESKLAPRLYGSGLGNAGRSTPFASAPFRTRAWLCLGEGHARRARSRRQSTEKLAPQPQDDFA